MAWGGCCVWFMSHIFAWSTSLGDEGWKPLSVGPCFSTIQWFKGKPWPSLSVAFAQGYTPAIIMATDWTKSKKKKIIESWATHKHSCQCTDWLSTTQNGWRAAGNSNHVARLTATHFNQWAMGLCWSSFMWLVEYRNLETIFLHAGLLLPDCSSWISRPDMIY